MAVSEDDVKTEKLIQGDFQLAKTIYNRIKKSEFYEGMAPDLKPLLFALCLIYARQLTISLKKNWR